MLALCACLISGVSPSSGSELPAWLPPCMHTDPPSCTFVAHNVSMKDNGSSHCVRCDGQGLCGPSSMPFEITTLVFDCVPGADPRGVSPQLPGWYNQDCTNASVYVLIANEDIPEEPARNGWSNTTYGKWTAITNGPQTQGSNPMFLFSGGISNLETNHTGTSITFATSSRWATDISGNVRHDNGAETGGECNIAASTMTSISPY